MMRGWDYILPGWRWLYELPVEGYQAASEVAVFTLCGAGSTRVITVFVPFLSDLLMYGRIHGAGAGRYPPRVALTLLTPGWGVGV